MDEVALIMLLLLLILRVMQERSHRAELFGSARSFAQQARP